jgi:small conductance mechanosensitive channel
MNTNDTFEKITLMAIEYAPKILMALLTLFIGFWIIGKITNFLKKSLSNSSIDPSLTGFLTSVASIAMKVMLLLSVAGQFGVNTTSFIAILGALMVGIGMALNGSIGHLASGVLLMIFKPFKVGDLVTIGGSQTGTVEAINAFNTTLLTLDNRKIIIANANVTDNTITNISGQGQTGVELTFGIGYDDNIDEARKIILQVGKNCPYILDEPAQGVVVAELADSSVNLATRPFCNSKDYWDTRFYMIENVKKEFDKAGVGIPYPQMDLHIKEHQKN